MKKYVIVETVYKNGAKSYRFVEGGSRASIKWANQLASKFARKDDVQSTRTYVSDEDEVKKLRANPKKCAAMRKKPSTKQIAARKLFAKRSKAGTLRKNPVKRKAAKHKFVKRKVVKRTATKRVARRKNPVKEKAVRRPPKRNPATKYVVRAVHPTKTGYLYYFLRGKQFVKERNHGSKFSKLNGEKKMRQILPQLPKSISSITLVRV